ncbi:response regulator [bacterium]|nr:response regulator [bacterium]
MTSPEEIILLLVEDDDIDAEGVERAFSENKIANPIVRANDGLEALELLETERFKKPYIILLDLNMPRMGGVDFLKALRKHPKHRSAVVFVLTTSNADKDIIAAYDEHISGFFVKNEMGSNFFDIAKLFNGYWKMVKLPS